MYKKWLQRMSKVALTMAMMSIAQCSAFAWYQTEMSVEVKEKLNSMKK